VTRTHELHGIEIDERWAALYFAAIGAAAGFFGSLVKLASNMAGASFLGMDPFKLLRVYGTIREGPQALTSSAAGSSLLDAFLMHLVFGSALGAIFMLFMWRRRHTAGLVRFLSDGLVYGLVIWIVNFYLLLSWIQPLVDGTAYIVQTIPWWVAFGSHALYGVTVALVAFPFKDDITGSL